MNLSIELRSERCTQPWRQGEVGWWRLGASQIYGVSNYPPGLAHDLLHHWDMQSLEDEVMAHGAESWMLLGRHINVSPKYWEAGNDIWWQRRGTYWTIRSNVHYLGWKNGQYGSKQLRYCPPQERLSLEMEKRLSRGSLRRHEKQEDPLL